MSPAAARKAALREFGGVEKIKEDCRDTWGVRIASDIWRDVRVSWRLLRKSKGFSFTCVLTLGLCIGGNAAIFSVLNFVLLKPLPFKDPDRLVEVYNTYSDVTPMEKFRSNFVLWDDYLNNTSAFERASLFNTIAYTFYDGDAPYKVWGATMTAEFFDTVGVEPYLGRFFNKSDVSDGPAVVIVLSFEFWQNQFGGDREIVGKRLVASGRNLEVIGVTPPGLGVINKEWKFYRPAYASEEYLRGITRHYNSHNFIGRLNDGVEIGEVTAQIRTRDQIDYEEKSQEGKAKYDKWLHMSVVSPLRDTLVRKVRPSLYLLQGGAFLVLLIGCVNLANLVFARASLKQFELWVRHSLGSGRLALARQILVECGLLTLGGMIAAFILSWILIEIFNRFGLSFLPFASPVSVGREMLIFILIVSGAVGIFLGCFSSLKLAGINASGALRLSTRTSTVGRRSKQLSGILVSSQIGITLALLVGSGLLFRSYLNANMRDLGFESRHVQYFKILIPSEGYTVSETLAPFQNLVLDSLNAIPGVDSASLSARIPMQDAKSYGPYSILPDRGRDGTELFQKFASNSVVSPGFFETMGINVLRGKDFNRMKGGESTEYLVISRATAQAFFGDEDPIGRRVINGFNVELEHAEWPRVIGMVEDVAFMGAHAQEFPLRVYRNIMVHDYDHDHKDVTILLRSKRPHASLVSDVRKVVRDIDKRIPIVSSGPLDDFMYSAMKRERMILWLVSAYAGLALLLATIGVYGMLAHDVGARKREIGIRSALGADYWTIVRQFFVQGMRMASIGIGLGLVLSVIIGRQVSSMLYEIGPFDMPTLALISLILLLIASIASVLPVMQYLRRNPIESLRCD